MAGQIKFYTVLCGAATAATVPARKVRNTRVRYYDIIEYMTGKNFN